jgi:hypothetical protein
VEALLFKVICWTQPKQAFQLIDNSITYIDPNINPVNFDVLYNVINDETFKKRSEGIPWKGGRRKPMF